MKYRLLAVSGLSLRSRCNVLPIANISQLRKQYKSDIAKEQNNHSTDTYQKDDTISAPNSSKTYVVDGDEKTQRPFEQPTGSYATHDPEHPYDEPIPKSENNHQKPRYGNLNRGSEGGAAADVDPTGNPVDQGREGRR